MTVLRMPPHCYGVKGAEGTYRTNPGGVVHVDGRDARRILRDPVLAGDVVEVKAMPHSAASKECPCGFVAFTWQHQCPKCGADITKETS